MPITLDLQPMQAQAFMTPATELLYGGAAGGGKSHLIRAAFIAWANMIPGLQLGLFRRMYPDLKANHLEGPTSFPALLAEQTKAGECRIVQGEITWSNGSRISLNHCQHEKDVFRYQGAEFHVLGFDELTHFTESQYRYLRGRLRMTGLKVPPHLARLFPRIISGSNPGGLGHTWVKEMFVNHGAGKIHRTSAKEGGMLRQFIPAKLSDNAILTSSDPDYGNRLEGLGDPVLVQALRDGNWDVAAGAMYGSVWRKARHTCDPFAIPIDWDIWMGSDDGYEAPAACYWITQNPQTKTFYIIAELHKAHMLPGAFAEHIKRISAQIMRRISPTHCQPEGPHTSFKGSLDSAAFNDNGTGDIPRGNQLKALGIRFAPVEKWPGSRVHRAQMLHKLLAVNPDDPAGGPGVVFFNTCVEAIKHIPALPRDKNNIEDVDTDGNDHSYDGVTYGLQYKKKRVGMMKAGN